MHANSPDRTCELSSESTCSTISYNNHVHDYTNYSEHVASVHVHVHVHVHVCACNYMRMHVLICTCIVFMLINV